MAGLVEVLRAYPLLSVALMITPFVGGIIGAYLGFDNLSSRLENEQQQQRIEGRQETIKTQLDGLSIPIDALRRYEKALQDQGQSFDVLQRILSQYDQLQKAVQMRERAIGREDSDERIATAEHILGELRALLGGAQTVLGPGGKALIIKTATNTFRVAFSVPMRIAPDLSFSGLPKDVEARVIEKTSIGFTVVFTPVNVSVEKFGFHASADF